MFGNRSALGVRLGLLVPFLSLLAAGFISGHAWASPTDPLFAAPFLSFDTGRGPVSVAIGDFNADGRPDLAVADGYQYGSSVSVLVGNGNGTFAARTDYQAGYEPSFVAIGDLNADGKLDLAVANGGSDKLSILLGNGDGTFAAKTDYGTGGNPYSVTIGDFNADGRPDLAVANYGSNTVSVLLGNGDGTFAAKMDYGTFANPPSVAIEDFNWDNRPDLAVAKSGVDAACVLLNIGEIPVAAVPDGKLSTSRLLTLMPNPAHHATTIEFESPAPEQVTLQILDISGRLTRVLSSGVRYPAGRNSLIWDGRNETGEHVARGVYFVRLQSGGLPETQKVLMLR